MLQLIAVAVNRGTTRDIARRGARANIGAMIFVNYDAVSCSCTRETPGGTRLPAGAVGATNPGRGRAGVRGSTS
jgi:hypothetical protein